MKKEQVQVGKTYAAKVSGSVVPVRITAEKWQGDKHVGWSGVNVRTNKPVRITSAQRLRNEVGPTPADDATPDTPATNAPGATEAAQAGTSANGPKKGGKPKAPPKTEAKPARAAKEPKPAKPKRVSAIDAAARVLAAAGKPMKAQEMVDAMEAQGLWRSPGGKTPAATLYAAVIREIAAKKKESRFRKTDRGTFEATAHAASAGKEG